MKYMGSKSRISKDLLLVFDSIMEKNRERVHDTYVEPFVGGANMIDKIGDRFKYKFGYDSNRYVIALMRHIQSGRSVPDTITNDEYSKVKSYPEMYEDWYVGFVGFCISFGAKFFGGYSRGRDAKGNQRNYASESKRNLEKQSIKLKGIIFEVCRYSILDIPHYSFVYCDPPYKKTTGYGCQFDHDHFWSWVRGMSERAIVVTSEYEAPEDFECIWEKENLTTISRNTDYKKPIERLFVLKNSIKH